MPDLILKVISVDAALPTQALSRSFDANGGTIGRDESNTLSLPDRHRRVSRLHATVSFPGGVATITNSSTSLPISVGEQALDFGESMPIIHGANIEIGPYILQAHALLLDASPMLAMPAASVRAIENGVADAVRAALPVAASTARPHSGMTVILPPPVAKPTLQPSPVVYSVPATPPLPASPQPQLFAQPLSASMLGDSDFSDLLGATATTSAAAISLPPMLAQPASRPVSLSEEAPAYASQPAPFVPRAVDASFGGAPFASAHDPFADLLAGIGDPVGGPAVMPAATLGDGGYVSPTPTPMRTPSGLCADPLAALGASPQPAGGTGAALLDTGTASLGVSVGRSGAFPDAFNPFDLPSNSGRNDADPLSALLSEANRSPLAPTHQGAHAVPSIDSLFQSAASSGSDAALLGFSAHLPANDGTLDSLIRIDRASDPMSLFGESDAVPASSSRAMRNDSLEVGSAFQPPLPRPPTPAIPVAAYVASPLPFTPVMATRNPQPLVVTPPPVSASPDALTEAFLRGAGLAPTALPHGLTPEIMVTIGSLLRSATAGAIDMLAARAATKREVQASVTIISVQANNPLKFLPNADSALLQLLGKKMPGFMRADVAMKDAFEDLRAHEVGVIAGTRAALTEVLGKFDPAVLGDKLTKGSVLESLMPSARKAKLWDRYLERYLQIRREAEDDFQSIFGRAFVQAYELETARIKGDTSGSGGE